MPPEEIEKKIKDLAKKIGSHLESLLVESGIDPKADGERFYFYAFMSARALLAANSFAMHLAGFGDMEDAKGTARKVGDEIVQFAKDGERMRAALLAGAASVANDA